MSVVSSDFFLFQSVLTVNYALVFFAILKLNKTLPVLTTITLILVSFQF